MAATKAPKAPTAQVEEHGFVIMLVINFLSALTSRFGTWTATSYFNGLGKTKIFRSNRISVEGDSYYYDVESSTLYTFHMRNDGSGTQVNRVENIEADEVEDALWEYREELMDSASGFKKSQDYAEKRAQELKELKEMGIQQNSRRRPVSSSASAN